MFAITSPLRMLRVSTHVQYACVAISLTNFTDTNFIFELLLLLSDEQNTVHAKNIYIQNTSYTLDNKTEHVTDQKGQDRTGQDRTGQSRKSQSGNISPIWGEAPTVPIRTKICMVGSLPDVVSYAKFQVEIFRGYNFTGGRISHFPIDF